MIVLLWLAGFVVLFGLYLLAIYLWRKRTDGHGNSALLGVVLPPEKDDE